MRETGLRGSTIPLPDGGFATVVYTPSESVKDRLLQLIDTINPAAFQPAPVPHSLAEAMQRDGVVPAPTIEPLPPNCEGHHAVEAPMPPFDTLQDDDEGGPGEPPRCATGGCGED